MPRKPTAPAGIARRETEFLQYLNALYIEVSRAKTHYEIYRELLTALEKNNREMNQAPGFWQRTTTAHLKAGLYPLERLLVENKDSLSIQKFLSYVESNQDLFEMPRFLTPQVIGFREGVEDSGATDRLREDAKAKYTEKQRKLQETLPERLKKDRAKLSEMSQVLENLKAQRDNWMPTSIKV